MPKISDLTELLSSELSDSDLLLVVDVSTGETKRIMASTLRGSSTGSGVTVQFGSYACDSTGTVIPLTSAFSNTDYTFLAEGQKAGAPVALTLGTVGAAEKTVSTIKVYPAVDGTTVNWIAVGV